MKRRLLNVTSVLSLLLFGGTAVLWVRSYTVADGVGVRKVYGRVDNPERKSMFIVSAGGGIAFGWVARADQTYNSAFPNVEAWARHLGWGKGWRVVWESSRTAEDLTYPYLTGYRGRFGFVVDSINLGGPPPPHPPDYWFARRLVVPHAAVLLALAVVPVVRTLNRNRRAYRRRMNLCPACGYDLRATPGRCPECGQTVSPGGGG